MFTSMPKAECHAKSPKPATPKMRTPRLRSPYPAGIASRPTRPACWPRRMTRRIQSADAKNPLYNNPCHGEKNVSGFWLRCAQPSVNSPDSIQTPQNPATRSSRRVATHAVRGRCTSPSWHCSQCTDELSLCRFLCTMSLGRILRLTCASRLWSLPLSSCDAGLSDASLPLASVPACRAGWSKDRVSAEVPCSWVEQSDRMQWSVRQSDRVRAESKWAEPARPPDRRCREQESGSGPTRESSRLRLANQLLASSVLPEPAGQ